MPLLVYFDKDVDEFPEMIAFRQSFLASQHLSLLRLDGEYKQGLSQLQESHHIQAIFLGQRSTDPHVPPTPLALTTKGWPSLMRVNPILYFDYTSVWTVIRALNAPYCCLYDQGFSSLGSKTSTERNPELVGRNGELLPAHTLSSECNERQGRE